MGTSCHCLYLMQRRFAMGKLFLVLTLICAVQGTFIDICANPHAEVSDACCNGSTSVGTSVGKIWVMKNEDTFATHDLDCKLEGLGNSRLLAINSILENDCILQYLHGEYPSTSTSKQYYIQLQDKEVEGVWEWKDEPSAEDGTPQKTAAIQHWAPGFPQGGETKPCVVFNFGDVSGAHPAGFWENVECSTMAEAICESQV